MKRALPPLPPEPLVTVIVPSFNQGAFIDDTVRSILQQDYARLETWVVDGGSTDGTVEGLRRYDHTPSVHWLSEPDRGYADAVNKGLQRSLGHLIGIQSSDDFYAPDAVREAVDLFAQHPDLVMLSGTFYRVDEKGAPYARHSATRDEEWLSVEQCARTGNYPCQSACFFRRDLALEVGGCDLDVDWVADHDLQVRLMAAGAARGGRTMKLDRCWACVRTHGEQRNQQPLKFRTAHIKAAHKYARDASGLFTRREARLMLQQAYWGAYQFRTSVLGQDVGALPHFVRAVLHTVEPEPVRFYLRELLRMAPLGIGHRLIEGLRWRMNAPRSPQTEGRKLPVTARWFA